MYTITVQFEHEPATPDDIAKMREVLARASIVPGQTNDIPLDEIDGQPDPLGQVAVITCSHWG